MADTGVRAYTHLDDVPVTEPGDSSPGFGGVQEFLERFGYLDRTAAADEANDDPTQEALARFQRFYGLEPTGAFDEPTREAMTRPRCAMPDPQDSDGIDFATTCAWPRRALTYAFDTGTDDVAGTAEFAAVRRAFATLQAVGGLTFTEVPVGTAHDIRVGWRPANDPDHSMVGGVIAHADFPPACGVVTNTLPKPVHFDDSEHTWADGSVAGAFDVETVALHEIGHIVGLAHSSVAGAVMAPTVSPAALKRSLTTDDVDGFRALYPAPPAPWSSWSSLGGVLTSGITVGTNRDGRMECFVRGTDGAVWHRWQTAPSNGWSGWASRGGVITSEIAVGRNADGRLEVFARGTDNALWHQWQLGSGGWSGWISLGGVITGPPSVGRNADGRMEVFARGTDGAVWHRWQVAPNSTWSGWSSLGGVITSDITVGTNRDGRMELFARGTDNAVWHKWQTAPNQAFSGWSSLGGRITSNIAVGTNADGRMELFVRGTDNALWHRWQTAPSNGWAAGWSSLGGVITTDPVVGRNRSGRMEVFARGTDNALWHRWQTAPNSGWAGWTSRGGVLTSRPAVASNADGRIEVFVRGTDNALWHQWQNQPFLSVDEDADALAGTAAGGAGGEMPLGAMATAAGAEGGTTVIDLDAMPDAVMPEPATADAEMPSGGMAQGEQVPEQGGASQVESMERART